LQQRAHGKAIFLFVVTLPLGDRSVASPAHLALAFSAVLVTVGTANTHPSVMAEFVLVTNQEDPDGEVLEMPLEEVRVTMGGRR